MCCLRQIKQVYLLYLPIQIFDKHRGLFESQAENSESQLQEVMVHYQSVLNFDCLRLH